MHGEGAIEQKYLGKKGLVLFLTALTAFPVLSTDLYLPALPGMTAYFGVPEYQTNLTLTLFFVVFAVAVLVWGPLSDRYGRKPILLVGLSCFVLGGALCSVASNVFQLMGFRILQALGTGAASTVATAIVKDVYRGRRREVIIAVIQTMIVISPAVAPVIGALILKFTSWRGTFVAQALLGLLVLAGTFVFRETLTDRLTGNPLASLKRLGFVLRNRTFVHLLLIFSLLNMAGMAFIASSSYIYQVTFGVSSQVYSYYFALFAVSMAAGAQVYVWISRHFSRTAIVTACFVVIGVSGLLILVVGPLGPWPFILALLPMPLAFSCMRPPATYLMLSLHEGDAGSVAALTGAAHMVLGAVGMQVVSLEVWGRIEMLGTMTLVLAVVTGSLWLALGRRPAQAEGSRVDDHIGAESGDAG